MRNLQYVLDEHGNPQPETDLITWAKWYEQADRHVAETNLSEPEDVRVSTVFLGVDHNHCGRGKPVLWETMIFGGPHNGEMRRYTSRADAEKGHAEMVALASGEA